MSFVTCTADFEAGVNGATIATGDTGSATAWNAVQVATSGVVKYDNTHVAHGSLAAKLDGGSASTNILRWGSTGGAALGSGTEQFGRFYIYSTAWPASDIDFLQFWNAGSSVLSAAWKTTGILGNMSTAIPLNQKSRVEWHAFHDASSGFLDVKLYTTFPDGTMADETKTLVSGNTGAACNQFQFGNQGAPGVAYTAWIDQAVAGGAAYPGPYPVNTIAPTVAGSTVVGSTLYCDGGTWSGGSLFTLTYQWTRNGVNLASATSATYATVDADASASIGCTVTATGVVATNESASQASSNGVTPTPPSPAGGGLVCRTLTR